MGYKFPQTFNNRLLVHCFLGVKPNLLQVSIHLLESLLAQYLDAFSGRRMKEPKEYLSDYLNSYAISANDNV